MKRAVRIEGELTIKKVDLNDLADKLQSCNDDGVAYYNKVTGETVVVIDGKVAPKEAAEDLAENEDNYVALPQPHEYHPYHFMEDFIGSLPEGPAVDELARRIHQRKPFRRFHDAVSDLDLLDKWYAFKEDAYVGVIKDWAADISCHFEWPRTARTRAFGREGGKYHGWNETKRTGAFVGRFSAGTGVCNARRGGRRDHPARLHAVG